MKSMSISPKTSLALLAIIVLVILVAISPQAQPAVNQSPAQNGRYQIVINQNARADTFLVDTQTGRVWGRVQISDVAGQPSIWKYEDKIDDAKQLKEWGSRQTFVAPGK